MLHKIFPEYVKTEILAIDMKILSILGFWPGNVINFRSCFFIFSCMLLEIFPGLCFIIKNVSDIQKVFMCLHEFISLIVLMIKVVILVIKMDKMNKLISDLRAEWKLAYDDENPHWRTLSEKQERTIYKSSRMFYSFIFISAAIYFTIPIVVFFLFFDYQNILTWPFPIQVYYGFEFYEQPLAYFILVIPTIVHMLGIVMTFYGLDFLYINLLVYCASYFRYVQCKIEHLNEKIVAGKIKGVEIKQEIAWIIKAHNTGIKFSEQLEDVSNILMLVLYTVNTIVLCFLFFEFNILSKDLLNLFKVLVFLGVVQILLLLFSYFGTKLMDESSLIADLIYDLPWYEIEDKTVARSLALCIIRAQRPCLITAAKFYPLNFESYLTAIKTAYSVCTVLMEVI